MESVLMIVKANIDLLIPWLEKHLRDTDKPHWGTSERIFTLVLAKPETSPGGIKILQLNKVAINAKQNEKGTIPLRIDPKVNTPAIVFEILPHEVGIELNVRYSDKRFDAYIERVLGEITARFGSQNDAPRQAGSDRKQTFGSWEQYKNDNPNWGKMELEIWTTGETFHPRSIACHSLPCRPYQHPFEDDELPNWDLELQRFRKIEKKVHALKTIIPAASDVSELQQCYNAITAKGRQTIFEQEIQWLWGGDMASLMEPHNLTEEDEIISQKIREHEESERMNRARAEGGERLDPPELETPSVFNEILTRFSARGQTIEIRQARKIRQIWLKVYEELAALFDEQVEVSKQFSTVVNDGIKLPKKPSTLKKWAKAYNVVVKTKREYQSLYEEFEVDDPVPKNEDYLDALKAQGIKYSERQLSDIIKAGDAGKLNLR